MRHFLGLVLGLMIISSVDVNAQCTPDPNSSALISPSQSEGLPAAEIGVAYSTVITFNIPDDTLFTDVDSARVDDVIGLPNGLSYECSPMSCVFPGGTAGCALISGTVIDPADTGSYDISTTLTAYGSNGFFDSITVDIDYYTIVVEPADTTSTGTFELVSQGYKLSSNVPNPFNGITAWTLDAPVSSVVELQVYNLTGAEVHSRKIKVERGNNTLRFDGSTLPAGVYFYIIGNTEFSSSSRMIISGK